MLKIVVVATLLAGSASFAFAQSDGDGNRIPGGQSAVSGWQTSSDGAYASSKLTRGTIARDGDANRFPGSQH
jgi:hypothetical protein